MKGCVSFLPIGAAVSLLVSLSGCRDDIPTTAATGGEQVVSCSDDTECLSSNGICVHGVCEPGCGSNGDCDEGMVCHSQKRYCVGCEFNTDCTSEGTICAVENVCISGTVAGACEKPGAGQSCNDRSMCQEGLVCTQNKCNCPPSRCRSDDDCQVGDRCNTLSGDCFPITPECNSDTNCVSIPGCGQDGCMCRTGRCEQKPPQCQTDEECGAFKYCTITEQCKQAPSCTNDQGCQSVGLAVCEGGICKNPPGCDMLSDCPDPQNQACVQSYCVSKNCVNTPELCDTDQVCNDRTGRCMDVTAGSCTTDAGCSSGYWCNNGVCSLGCRSQADCQQGFVCDAQHQCQSSGGGTGSTACSLCADDTPCSAGSFCVPVISMCLELCIVGTPCSDGGGCTDLFGLGVGICADCFLSGLPPL